MNALPRRPPPNSPKAATLKSRPCRFGGSPREPGRVGPVPGGEQAEAGAEPSLGDRVIAAGAMAVVADRLGPGGTLALAPFLPLAEVLISKVRSELTAGTTRRQAQMLGVAAEELRCDAEE